MITKEKLMEAFPEHYERIGHIIDCRINPIHKLREIAEVLGSKIKWQDNYIVHVITDSSPTICYDFVLRELFITEADGSKSKEIEDLRRFIVTRHPNSYLASLLDTDFQQRVNNQITLDLVFL